MVDYNPLRLPTAEDLPDSDETPVDNELQDLVPHLLKAILALIWQHRTDWFFGVDMGIYHHPRQPAIVPDGFLSLGVNRFTGERGRLSYVLWEENGIVPILALEVVSQNYNSEYQQKKIDYAQLGILYYVIYNPGRHHRSKGQPFEVHRLVDGVYVRCSGEPVWIPEINLAIGREVGNYEGWTREWLYWYSVDGQRFLTPEEQGQQAQQQLEQERLRAERYWAQLRALGVEPDEG